MSKYFSNIFDKIINERLFCTNMLYYPLSKIFINKLCQILF